MWIFIGLVVIGVIGVFGLFRNNYVFEVRTRANNEWYTASKNFMAWLETQPLSDEKHIYIYFKQNHNIFQTI